MEDFQTPMNSELKQQEESFLATGIISPVFLKNNHGIPYAIYYKNGWKDNRCEKLFQKTVGRVLDDGSIEFGKKFLSQYPQLKGSSAKLSGRKVRLSGGNVSAVMPPMAPMAEQRQAFFRELDQDTRLSAGASYVLWEIARQNHMMDDLEDVFGKDKAAVMLSLSIFFQLIRALLLLNLKFIVVTLGFRVLHRLLRRYPICLRESPTRRLWRF